MEKMLEEISFESADSSIESMNTIVIDEDYVNKHLSELTADADLAKFIL